MKNCCLLLLFIFSTISIHSQNENNWNVQLTKSKSFIENRGQFDEHENEITGKIRYAVDFGFSRIYFGDKGVSYNFHEVKKKTREERRAIMNTPVKTFNEHKQKEELVGKFLIKDDQVNMSWINPNRNVEITGIYEASDYHSYSFTNEEGLTESINHIKGFEKIIYKNIFPNIDIEYQIHPISGVKYAFIVRPGGNTEDIRMQYDREFSLISNEVHINTLFGDIVDHAPLTFYENDEDFSIESAYKVEDNRLTFSIGEYDRNATIVIDPWVQTPNDPNSNWDCAWELDVDASGNVYVIAGISPMQLLKYNSGGSLQWTHNTPYDTTAWLGTMATDDLGNSYVTNGTDYMIQKIDNAGNVVWNNSSPGGGQISTEFWNISFNCDQTKLIVGGTGGNLDIHGKIYEIDMNSGNILNQMQVSAAGNLFAIPPSIQEVRAMSSAPNGKYYFLTLDTIGYMSDDFTLCPNGSTSLLRDNQGIGWGYKCENWRYNNTGIKAIRADANFVYVHRGNQLQKRSLIDFSIIGTVTIPGGNLQSVFLGGNQSHNAGIDIDQCGNIYVGSTTGVYKFDSNLNQLANYPTAFKVWDVRVSSAGDIVACGGTGTSSDNNRSGGIQSFAAAACAPIALTCCNATVCIPESLCQNDPPLLLTPAQSGGTWSGTGVDALGNFDPAVSGPGVFNITYTLPCGSETIAITVDPCATLDVCEETNGDLTVSGGNGSYTWYEGTITPVSVPISTEQECIDCPTATPQYIFGFYTGCSQSTCNYTDTVWTQYATGTTAPPPSAYPIQIVDGNGTTIIIDNAGVLVPCTANPCAGVTITTNTTAQSNVSCFGGSNGSATVDATGGTATYSYIWSPGNLSGASQSGLSAGTYTIAVQDNNGCNGAGTVTITEPAELIASAISTSATCGASDGTATGSASGGTGSYSYSWSPVGGTNATATGLAPDVYTVTVTDQNGCTDDAQTTVSTTNGPSISVDNFTDVSCFGLSDGTASVSATGGTVGYSYSWMPGSLTGSNQTSLAAGTYTVTVTDGAGCTDVTTVDIIEPSELLLSTSTIVPANCGANDGSATVDVSGGAGSYTYVWTPNVSSAATASNIPGGAYAVEVTDANLCTETINLTVPTLGGPSINVLNVSDVTCFGASDGSATIEASGGGLPYTYSWSPSGGTDSLASGLSAGNYTVTVTDNGGCISVENITISEPTEIIITETIVDENCGQSDGSISLVLSGGTGGYTYLWSPNGETTSSLSGLVGGSYNVTVSDASGCTSNESFVVDQVGSIPVTASPESSTITAGESVQLNASGALDYIWTPTGGLSCSDCSNPVASPTVTTTYIVTGTDASGCTGADTVLIIVETECADLFVPNIFSPNGLGPDANELLCVFGDCISSLSFNVYNRWGELVFSTETAYNSSNLVKNEICWDGTHRGKMVQSGVYVYTIFAEMFNGDVVEESGNITVVR